MVFTSTTNTDRLGALPQHSVNRQIIGVPVLIQRGSPMVSTFRRAIILAPRGPAGLDFDVVFVVDMQPAVNAVDLEHLIPRKYLLPIPRPGRHSHFSVRLPLNDDGRLVAGREFFENFFLDVCSAAQGQTKRQEDQWPSETRLSRPK